MNPWDVPNIEVFAKTFYCCPECDVKEESNEKFIKHALNEHPNSRENIPKLLIKQEITEAFPNHNDEDLDDYYFKAQCSKIRKKVQFQKCKKTFLQQKKV